VRRTKTIRGTVLAGRHGRCNDRRPRPCKLTIASPGAEVPRRPIEYVGRRECHVRALLGRRSESEALERLLDAVRGGESRALAGAGYHYATHLAVAAGRSLVRMR
jgi:hypothetical protein